MIKLVATDLDGTLLGDDKVIPPEIFEIVPKLKAMGITFVAASGRSPYTLRENFRPIADDIDYLCDNGAVAIAGGEIIFEKPVPMDVLETVYEFCKNEDVHMLFCGSKTTYLAPVEGTKYEPYVRPYYFRRMLYEQLLKTGDAINKIAMCDMRNPRTGSYDRLVKVLRGRAVATVSGDIWMDVMQNGVDKGVALEAVMKYRGVTSEETMVFGDYYNDVPMLEKAKYSYVMRNANPDMFRYGNYIADSNNDGGVLKVLRSLIDGTFSY